MLQRILNIFGNNYGEKQLKKIEKFVIEINKKIDEEYQFLSNEEIQENTKKFINRIKNGETLDNLLVEAFANVKEACKRLVGTKYNVKGEEAEWNMIPYDVQLLGGIALHQGKISEMKTGEGKTLVAVLPLYLNALEKKGVHLVTVNNYLASRDADITKIIFEWLGLSVGCITKETDVNKRIIEYSKDITYVENSELGFDYLRDNLATDKKQRNLLFRKLNYAIIDEVDSILIDEARTPLIISQQIDIPVDKYKQYKDLVKMLTPAKGKKKVSKGFLYELMNESKEKSQFSKKELEEKKIEEEKEQEGDYFIDEKLKTALLSENGIRKIEGILGIENLYKDLGYDEIHHIENALKAKSCYLKDKDYIVKNGEVLIVDENTGRTMEGRRFSEGLHQAIEAKEEVEIKKESKTLATITYQNFFKQYKKLAGMTGTAMTEGEEFDNIYKLETIEIKTNRPIIRVDKPDHLYFNQQGKWNRILEVIGFYHKVGQPILIGTSSIHTSEYLSSLLQKENIIHSVLNAKQHELEAHIIANAGRLGSVVVATNMAGRGTDIKLESGLNEKIADNYINWVKNNIKGLNDFTFNIFSEKELKLTLNAINKIFNENITFEFNKIGKSEYTLGDVKLEVVIKKQKEKFLPYAVLKFNCSEKDEKIENKISQTFSDYIIDIHYGLFILGTEKHESRRIDNQLRGRSGRQGDPGVSVFFAALDDLLMRKVGGEKIQLLASMFLGKEKTEKMELKQQQFTRSIIRSQKQIEAWHFGIRKSLFEYDSVIDKQRQSIYQKRDNMIEEKDFLNNIEIISPEKDVIMNKFFDKIKEIVKKDINETITSYQNIDINMLLDQFSSYYGLDVSSETYEENKNNIIDYISKIIIEKVDKMIKDFGEYNAYTTFSNIYLETIDYYWIDHIDDMTYLREKVSLMGYAQQDPLIIYKKEAFEKYQFLLSSIERETISKICKIKYQVFEKSPKELKEIIEKQFI